MWSHRSWQHGWSVEMGLSKLLPETWDSDDLPREAWVTAVASLSDIGPGRIRHFCETADPRTAWARLIATGVDSAVLGPVTGPEDVRRISGWVAQARALDPESVWRKHCDAGVGVSITGSASYPAPFVDDPYPPQILFHMGDPEVVAGPRVAVVGTRDCTRYGYDVAYELGRDLAIAGVRVVSGLALGIDGAAHMGAVEADCAPPIAVVGSGLDIPYPSRNRSLWEAVSRVGVVFSEYPLGVRPAAWRFPARNRLIAALADVVVVVESHDRGGALLTVDEAIVRGRDVMAVPGPVRAKASAGANKLLAEGRGVVRSADDVLDSLGIMAATNARGVEKRRVPDGQEKTILEAMEWRPVSAGELVEITGIALGGIGLALDALETSGWIEHRGGYYERVVKREN